MALLVAAETSLAGIDLDSTFVSPSPTGDEFYNNESINVMFRNNGTTDITVTINGAVKACNFGVTDHIHDQIILVPAGKTIWSGPFSLTIFNNVGGHVEMTYSDTTDLLVSVLTP